MGLQIDSPWRRLPLTLPGALLLGALVLWAGAVLLPSDPAAASRPPTLEARLIELPPPPPPHPPTRKPRRAKEPAETPPKAHPPASLAAPPAPSAEEWQLASTYTLKNSKRYRNAWGQQVRSQMGTAVAGPDQGQVRFRITLHPDGRIALVEELWSTSAKASQLARKAIAAMPRLPPTPTGKALVFEQTISFLPYETGWPPSYRYDCLPDPPAFKNPFAWNGADQPPNQAQAPTREAVAADCHPSDVKASFEEEESELERQVERNRWGS